MTAERDRGLMVLKKKVIAALQFVLEMTLFWGMTQALGIERDMAIESVI